MKVTKVIRHQSIGTWETIKLMTENGRPITLLAPILIVTLYYFVLNEEQDLQHLVFDYIMLILGVASLRLGINNINNVYDIEADEINKPNRPIVRGDLALEAAFINGWLLQFISLFIFMLLSPFAFLLDLSFIVVGGLYNMDNGLKNIFPINNLIIAYVRGFGYMLAVYTAVPAEKVGMEYFWVGIFTTLYIFGAINSKDIRDVEGDKKVGRKTLPILLEGREHLLAGIIAPVVFSPVIIISVLVMIGSFSPVYLLIWFIAPFDLIIIYYINKATSSRLTENTTAWLFMIITYFGHLLVFSIILGNL